MQAGQPPAGTVSVALFASGSGSNFAALLERRYTGAVRPHYRCLIGNNSGAHVMALARARGVPAYHVSRHTHPSRDAYFARLTEILIRHETELIVLTGYMKLLPGEIVRRWRGRILNIHPALLPRHGGRGMYGMAPHRAVLAAGERDTGVTVHFVDGEYDRGRILMQRKVPVLPDDTPHTLAGRVLALEHDTYWRAVERVATELAAARDGQAPGGGPAVPSAAHAARCSKSTAPGGTRALSGATPAVSGRELAAPARGVATGGGSSVRAAEQVSGDRAVGQEPVRSASAAGRARGRRGAHAVAVAASDATCIAGEAGDDAVAAGGADAVAPARERAGTRGHAYAGTAQAEALP